MSEPIKTGIAYALFPDFHFRPFTEFEWHMCKEDDNKVHTFPHKVPMKDAVFKNQKDLEE